MKDFIEGYTMFIDMYYYRRGIMTRYNRFKRYQRFGEETETKRYGMPISKNPPPPPRRPIVEARISIKIETSKEWNKDVTVLERDDTVNILFEKTEDTVNRFIDTDIAHRIAKLEKKLKDNGSMSLNKEEHYKKLKHLEDYLNKKGIHIPKLQSYSVFGTDRLINK